MMIKSVNQLDKEQLSELELLIAECKQADGSAPNVYFHILNQSRILPASLLYYRNKQLIGFLSAYFFYDDAVELAVVIKPSARRQKIASELIHAILPLIKQQNRQNLIFSNPAHKNDLWLKKRGFTYLHSEYYMERNDLNPILDCKQSLQFRSATDEDIPVLCSIDELCFPKHQSNLNERFENLMHSREYKIILAFKNNQLIGKAHLRWEKKSTTLSDIAIIPAHQGNGYGTALIAHCINHSLSEGTTLINLDVETHNLKALNLYTRLGFMIQNACDYWSIDADFSIK